MTSATEEYRTEKGLARAAQSLAGWTERWFPDAYVFALAGVVLVAVAALVQMNLGWTVQIYNVAQALPNLSDPFFMLPLLAVLGPRARNLVGFTFLQFVFHFPAVLVWLLGMTFDVVSPVVPAEP